MELGHVGSNFVCVTCCVTWDKVFTLSESQCPHIYNEDKCPDRVVLCGR